MAQATVSRNASDLAESGVLACVKDGNKAYYQRAEITEGLGIEEEIEHDLELGRYLPPSFSEYGD